MRDKRKEKFRKQQNDFTDPVCGMQISHNTAATEAEYGKKTYYFCAPVCRERFLEEPEKFVRKSVFGSSR